MASSDGFISQMSSSKTYTQGSDRYGRPVIYVHVAKHRTFDQSPKALEDFVIFQMVRPTISMFLSIRFNLFIVVVSPLIITGI